ncbi:MAG TPA: biliverdin-producing heme oxygenase [Cyclobacteriaceae bacterium]|nr:biliverdin-producing heme oxygenase [Cyclobacteriaceae bacterium]
MTPLKEATSTKHKQAERMPFNVRMFRGQLTKDQYALYLNQQLLIFQTIEHLGLPNPSLSRVSRIQADLAELNNAGHANPLVLDATRAYSDYLAAMTYEQVLPHIYLNYMALMFGGQMMKKSVPSSGKIYDFDNVQEAIQSIRAVQQDAWADEVNKGFDFNIALFEELELHCINQPQAAWNS